MILYKPALFEPNPGEYIILKKILITQCATRYRENYSVGYYASPGESHFVHRVEKIDTVDERVLFRGEIKDGSWITLNDSCHNEIYAQLKVHQYLKTILIIGFSSNIVSQTHKLLFY